MTHSQHPTILVTPIGIIPEHHQKSVAESVQEEFGLETRIVETLADVEFARDRDREQYHSTAILEALQPYLSASVLKIVALVEVDLFIPILTHVYGEAQLGGGTCIVSTHRLVENLTAVSMEPELTVRLVKEAFHELGHTFELLHCKDPSCIMHYCRSIRDVDRKSNRFCRYCSIMLQDVLKKMRVS